MDEGRTEDPEHPERPKDARLAYAFAHRLAEEFGVRYGEITFKIDGGTIHAVHVTRRLDERDIIQLTTKEFREQELRDSERLNGG